MWKLRITLFFLLLRGIISQSNGNNQLTADAQAYVDAHNQIRLQRGLPSVSWDFKLASFAQSWAIQRADDCNPFAHSLGDYGENIMWELYDEDSPTQIVQGWAAEENNFDLHLHKCKCEPETETCKCGHYTQVVWRTTTKIGCGNNTCNALKGFIVVCSYDPPGNYVDEDPYWPSDCGYPPPSVTYPPPPPPPPSPPPPLLPPPLAYPPPPLQSGPSMQQQPLQTGVGQAPLLPSPNTNEQQLHQAPARRKGHHGKKHRKHRKQHRKLSEQLS